MRICFLLAFVMSAAMAFPQDEVIPETSPTLSQLSVGHPELKHATPKDAAHAKIKMMQAQGFDNTQCKQLATDAITGMTSTLKAEQDTMTALSTGADCLVVTPATRRLLGIAAQQQLLDDAAAALVLAKADLATKETALATASSAPVSITMTLDTIGTNMAAIGQAVSLDSAVVSAKAAVATAQTVKDAANLVVVADQASFDTAVTAAQDSSQECLCNAKAAHDIAWPNAQKVVTDNTQAWKEAHHVKCALDGTADDACTVPPFTVTNTVLVTEAANPVCSVLTKIGDDNDCHVSGGLGSNTDCAAQLHGAHNEAACKQNCMDDSACTHVSYRYKPNQPDVGKRCVKYMFTGAAASKGCNKVAAWPQNPAQFKTTLFKKESLFKKVCTVAYTRHQGQIRTGWTGLAGTGLIPTKPPCVSNDDWTAPFCRAGKYPQSLAIGAERCKVACDARPECTGMVIAHPSRGTTAECYLAGGTNVGAFMSHGISDYYDRDETCN